MSSGHDDPDSAAGQMMTLHQSMTELMRVDDQPVMLQMMNANPMWAAMRTPAFIAQQDEHQQEINRMLGLGN